MNLSATGFLGTAPRWYANTVLAMLAGNIALSFMAAPAVLAWSVVAEFIFTLAMALKCYPLGPGGLIALEAVLLRLTTPARVYVEVANGLPVILLLLFMVTAVYFMRELLLYLFSRMLVAVRSQLVLALLFCLTAALLSAFLDALTVLAVVISVAMGFHALCQEHAAQVPLEQLRAALRGLLMHAAVGTAFGGVATLVGEPQNLLIAKAVNWDFREFVAHIAPVSLPVLVAGLVTCLIVERFRLFGFGAAIPAAARDALVGLQREQSLRRTPRDRWRLRAQAACGLLLVIALGLHVAEVGLIGLMLVVVLTAVLGVEEEALAEGFKGALPFTAVLVVFFSIVAVIDEQNLFQPVIAWVLARDPAAQPAWLYLANGLLSAISDNVFVATIYIAELQRALHATLISPAQMEVLAVAVNTGTNIPSIATPNGQAAFLFLLTSALAPRVNLTYTRMVWMALPYFAVTTLVGLLAVFRL